MEKDRYLQVYKSVYQELCKWDLKNAVDDNPPAALIFLVFMKFVDSNSKELNLAEHEAQLQMFWKCHNDESSMDKIMRFVKYTELTLGYKQNNLSRFIQKFAINSRSYEFTSLMAEFDSLEFSVKSVGYAPYDYLVEYISMLTRRDLRVGTEAYTDPNLARLMAEAADVKDGQRFLDFTAGYGISAIECVKNTQNTEILLQDIQNSCSAVSTMLLTISGIKKAQVSCGDSFQEFDTWVKEGRKFDRIVCDPPLGYKITKEEMVQSGLEGKLIYPGMGSSADMIPLRIMLMLLDEKGIGVLLVPMGILSRMSSDRIIREKIVQEGCIDSVIELPSGIIAGSAIRMAMLVIRKSTSYTDRESCIYFLNLNMEEGKKYIEKLPRAGYTIQKEKTKEIADMIAQHIPIDGLSKIVSQKAIADNNYSLSPSAYIELPIASMENVDFMISVKDNWSLLETYHAREERLYKLVKEYMKIRDKQQEP